MNIEDFKLQLEKEGFKHVYAWRDEPGTVYAPHSHKDKVSFYIAEGSVDFEVDDKKMILKEGDCLDVLPGTKHSAKVGSEGCLFVVGEMIEGDS